MNRFKALFFESDGSRIGVRGGMGSYEERCNAS